MQQSMAEPPGPLEGGPLRLEPDVYSYYSGMYVRALGTAEFLRESWNRPKRHNRRIERAALWYTVSLDQGCQRALHPAQNKLLLPPSTDQEIRYELQAGIRTVHDTFPFSPRERELLEYEVEKGNPRFENDDVILASDLVQRWHGWLWMDDQGVPQNSTEALGSSAILAEACMRLCDVLPQLMGV
jgi:hypothetical protein